MKRILKSRRGAAMESALFFMLVVFALSMLLLSSITAMGYRNLADERAAATRREVEQIGVYFAANDARLGEAMAGYGYTNIGSDSNTLKLQNENGKILLTVTLDDSGNVVCWRYGE